MYYVSGGGRAVWYRLIPVTLFIMEEIDLTYKHSADLRTTIWNHLNMGGQNYTVYVHYYY